MSQSELNLQQEKRQAMVTVLQEAGGGKDTLRLVENMLAGLSPVHLARILESTAPKIRHAVWELIPWEQEAKVLHHIREDVRGVLLKEMQADEVSVIIKNMAADDIADILQKLPTTVTDAVLNVMSSQDRRRLERVLDFPEDVAGGLMDTDMITTRETMSIEAVLRYLRWRADLPPMLESLIVVDRKDHFRGILPVGRLLAAQPSEKVRDLVDVSREPIPALTPASEVAEIFERNDLLTAPVVDDQGILLGRITLDDVLPVVRSEAERPMLGRVGLFKSSEEDTFSPVLEAVPGRLLWLGINLVTAFVAAGTISIFEDTLDKVVALAILMPIVASMGGIAGSQILTIMERGIGRGNIDQTNIGWLFKRETILGLINGIVWAVLVAAVAFWWFEDPQLSLLIGIALLINLFAAVLSGVFLPFLLRKMGIDPAIAGSVILTTLTDVVGFGTFLGLATLAYA